MNAYIRYLDSNIYYQKLGNGPCVVFLHGFLESSQIFEEIISVISKTNTCIAIDLPGHGQSQGLNESFNMNDLANLVHAILVHEKISRASFVGHSLGAYISFELLDAFAELVTGICVFHSSAAADSKARKNNRNKAIRLIDKDSSKFLTAFMPHLFAPKNRDLYQSEIKALMQCSENIKIEDVVKMIEAMRDRRDYSDVLKAYNGSKLYIIGKEDPILPSNELVSQARYTRSHFIVLENVGHMGFVEDFQGTLASIMAFKDKCSADALEC